MMENVRESRTILAQLCSTLLNSWRQPIKTKPFSPQRTRRTQRKPLMLFLRVLRVLCGESVFSVPRTNLPWRVRGGVRSRKFTAETLASAKAFARPHTKRLAHRFFRWGGLRGSVFGGDARRAAQAFLVRVAAIPVRDGHARPFQDLHHVLRPQFQPLAAL